MCSARVLTTRKVQCAAEGLCDEQSRQKTVSMVRHVNWTSKSRVFLVICALFAALLLICNRSAKISEQLLSVPGEQHCEEQKALLLFNRVPKCGGTTLITLLKKLQRINNFTHASSKIYDRKQLNADEQVCREIINYIFARHSSIMQILFCSDS